MIFSKTSDPPSSPPPPQPPESYYNPLPSEPHPQPQTQYVILLPRYYNPTSYFRRLNFRRIICISLLLLLTAATAFFLWPSDPQVSIVRLHLKRFHLRTFPLVALDIALDVTVRVRNRDFYSIDYKSLFIAVGYRGKHLGHATSQGGHIRARGSSYVNATFELNGVEVLADIFPLLEDLAKGKITFDTETKVGGQLGLLFFEIPLQGQVSCEMIVNIHNQTIEHQNCYPH